MNDPYRVLNISSNASDDEVKRAYRELSKKYHPDSYADNPLADLAEDKFKEIQEAYKEIMDMRAGGGNSTSGSYNAGGQTYNPYGQGFKGQQGFQSQYNQNQYVNFGRNYGRTPGRMSSDDACDLCCKLWCADTMCECLGGDLCTCF
jgi:molecular chaperone DnaJ